MDLAAHAKLMRSRVFRQMLETRGWKYRSFLRYLRVFKYVSFAPLRGSFLESYYTLMRFLDDVVDGDLPLPEGWNDAADYLENKIAFALHPVDPHDEVDYLMLHCFALAKRFGQDFSSETADILGSLLFDARRKGRWIFFPAAELEQHFHRLDIRGTIRATLKIFREDPEAYPLLAPLGTASRYQYDLEDLQQDLAAGYINIPAEEALQFGLCREELLRPQSPALDAWCRWHAEEGLRLLEEHHRKLAGSGFGWLARATFPLVYERPARHCFQQVLKNHSLQQACHPPLAEKTA